LAVSMDNGRWTMDSGQPVALPGRDGYLWLVPRGE
jgi:hypothetical protein